MAIIVDIVPARIDCFIIGSSAPAFPLSRDLQWCSVPRRDRSRAESAFEEYLRGRNLAWAYEELSGSKKPDYVLEHPTGKCVIEVKEIEDPDPLPLDGFHPDRAVRNKIKAAQKQFHEYKQHCCSLAVFTESMFGPSEPITILGAAFGPGHQQAGRDYSRIDPAPSFYRFPRESELPPDLRFLSNPILSPKQNRTFSALILLGQYELNELHLEVWRRLHTRQQAGQSVDHADHLRLLTELGPTLAESRHHRRTIRAIVIENPYARIPFPADLFRGPFDQRWGWNGRWCGPVWIGSTLESLSNDGVPFYML